MKAVVAFATMMLLAMCMLAGCTPSDVARGKLKRESEISYGVTRTVTAYSHTGEQIGKWHGKIDVDYSDDNDRVDIVVFDGKSPVDRIVISDATVIVDND